MKNMTRQTLHYCQPLLPTVGPNQSQVDPPGPEKEDKSNISDRTKLIDATVWP